MAGIYIHIPFCKQKCHYCNFFSVASQKNKAQFLEVLLDEIRDRQSYLGDEKVNTIYFGGGTPSVLSLEEIKLILTALNDTYNISPEVEITLEANPDDLSKLYLKELQQSPINRLSIGVQSFFDEDLIYLNRVHNGEQALGRVKDALSAGFHNMSIDLIYGIPTLTNEKWEQNLQQFFDLNIPHLSAYSLTVEPKTALHKLIKKNKLNNIDDEQSIAHFKILQKRIKENGFEHYEISNFSKPGYNSKHNSLYWLGGNYLGLGPSAHSFNGNSRQWNVSSLSKYLQQGGDNELIYEKEILTKVQQFNEYMMTSLRTSWGCSLQHIENVFGLSYASNLESEIQPFIQKGQVFKENNILYLSEEGKLFADGIASELFISED